MKNIIVAMLLWVAVPAMAEPSLQHATGSFTVAILPQASDGDAAGGVTISRLAVSKIFSGGLVGTGKGDMLAAGDGVTSGAYVLIERVSGTLDGKAGSFALMHHATMAAGKPDQHISIVPGSGTGALAGISGELTMRIDGGTHFYDLAYAIAPR